MSRSFSLIAALALAIPAALPLAQARANPPGTACAEPGANLPYRVVVHAPQTTVVVIEEDGDRRWLKLFGHCHKKKEPAREAAPVAFYVPVPVMVPVASPPPCAPAAAAPCASNTSAPCASGAAGPSCRTQTWNSGADRTSVASAGEDLRLMIARLKALRADHEAEIAAIDSALAPVSTPSAKPSLRAVSAPIAPATGVARQDIKDLNDKIDYLTALVDALADDIRKTDKLKLPAFDELNGLRKTKP